MPDPNIKHIFTDPTLLTEAANQADKYQRSLRRVRELPHRDMVVYECRETGNRRSIPTKYLLALGAPTAFELAGNSPQLIRA
tara:strand:- start:3177 stop:3422 length:246 start_codon:yes stop_codon:yes gene_type:complete